MSARSTPPRPPSRNHSPNTSSCRNQRGHSNQHVDQIYRDERERQERLVGQISGWRSDAAVLRAAGDREGAERVAQMVESVQHLQCFLQQRAPERVFERVNSVYANEIVIDCHALHANEAVAKVKAAMKGFDSCSGVAFSVSIVTGKGTHSRDGVPVLLPAIRRYLIDQAYPFREGDGFISINFGK